MGSGWPVAPIHMGPCFTSAIKEQSASPLSSFWEVTQLFVGMQLSPPHIATKTLVYLILPGALPKDNSPLKYYFKASAILS